MTDQTTHDQLITAGLSEHAIARKIIQQVIKDLGKGSEGDFLSAEKYVNSTTFIIHLGSSGYPLELRDTLKELVLLSKAERRFVYPNILVILSDIPRTG